MSSKAVFWWGYSGAEEEEPPRSHSKQNSKEATLAATIVLSPSWPQKRSVMVITFYKAQEKLIRDIFAEFGITERPEADATRGTLRITTVDQAQGSESDIVILSCVRSNAERSIGFVSNRNRMNVAVSRARERLIVIGDVRTMSKTPEWASLLARSTNVSSAGDLPRM